MTLFFIRGPRALRVLVSARRRKRYRPLASQCGLEMEMTHQPDDQQRQRDYQNQKNDPAFAPFFAQRFPAATSPAHVSPPFVLERDGNVEAAPAFRRADEQFLALPAGGFLRNPRGLGDHLLELLHFAPKLRFLLG